MLRRDFTNTLLVSALCKPAPAKAEDEPIRLRKLAAQRGLLVGSAVSYMELQRSDFAGLLGAEASIVVSENDMKWRRIHPEPDHYDFRRGDALLAFAGAHGQKLRGHNLCWHEYNPEWLARLATRRNAADLLRGHIAAVAGHYAGHVHSWDVVNEAVSVSDGRPDGLRQSIWLELIGPEYVEMAFRAAAAADPGALLTYNDYDLEQESPDNERKRQAVLRLLQSLRERGAPVHALGLQSHLRAGPAASRWDGLHRFLEQVEKLGLQVFVTELDVDDRELPADVAERDRGVAALYRDYLGNVLQHRSVKAVLTWGLTDADTWLNHSKPRADGLPQRPLPFDMKLQPKPAFFAMREVIAAPPDKYMR
jgi:endo-1,4-beta-xylanase